MAAAKRTKPLAKSIQKAFSYIRFSTAEQARGHSFQRQFQQTVEYAKKRGLVLDETAHFLDRGVSAFKGANRNSGALGNFLQSVESGLIPKDSILIVESLDRLSREEIMKSVATFMEILGHGIEVVTLSDGERSFTSESVNRNPMELMLSIMILSRAHEESKTKSLRIGAAWKAKRETPNKKLTARAPAWVKMSKDRSCFHLIPERAAIIRRIFELSSKGVGKDQIARVFNKEKLASWPDGKRGGNGWHNSYIQKILANRAVIGEFQPHRKVAGKRVPEGKPIKNYFPPVIDSAFFASVQIARKERGPKGGRKGVERSNLFSHLAKCGYCGAAMVYVNKGGDERYLACSRANRGLGCVRKRWRYSQFEEMFLWYGAAVDVEGLVPSSRDKERATSVSKVAVISRQLENLREKRSNLAAALMSAKSSPRSLVTIIEALDSEEDDLNKKLEEAKNRVESLSVSQPSFEDRFAQLSELLKSQNRLLRREWLASEFRRLIDRVLVYTDGCGDEIRKQKKSGKNRFWVSRRYFEIEFKNSISLAVIEDMTPDVVHCAFARRSGKTQRGLSKQELAAANLGAWSTFDIKFLDEKESKLIEKVEKLVQGNKPEAALHLLSEKLKDRRKLVSAVYRLLCDQLPVSEEEVQA